MESAAKQPVVEMVSYIRETIAQIDRAIAELQSSRVRLVGRLAVLEAASDPYVLQAAADYESRVESKRPYEDAEDANSLILEAQGRFLPS